MKTLSVTLRRPFSKPVGLFGMTSAKKRIAFCVFSTLLCASPVFADNMTEINGLIRGAQYPEALSKVDAGLVQAPRDKQLRFLKGVILTEQSKPTEAIAVFTKLTEDFPELPEPYNNLAVLFAAGGQYDKARAALEMAIRTNPTYATAHENLGDVYAKLASQAYDKALQLDSSNTTAKSKLTLIRTLVGPAAATDAKSAAISAGAKPQIVPVPAKMPATVTVKPEAKIEIAKADIQPKVVPKAELKAKVETKLDDKPKVVATDNDRDEVMSTVNAWAKAWSARDVAGYLSYYTSDFQPSSNQSHKNWADDRRARIEGKGNISVKIETPKISVDGNSATVKFRQQYASDRLHSNGPKTLVLIRHAGKWQIKQEHAGS